MTLDAPRPARAGRRALRLSARSPEATAGAVLLLALVLLAAGGPHLYPYDHVQQDHAAALTPPSAEHWLGTSRLGEDLLAQSMRGLQKSLAIGVLVAVLATGLAAVVGTLAGYLGGRADRVLMLVADVLLVLPPVLLIAVASPVLRDHSWLLLILGIAALQWMLTSRIVRARTVSLRRRDDVRAAELMGAGTVWIVRKHLLPNMAALLAVDATIQVGAAVLTEAGLSYLGFGVRLPDVSLGTLIATGGASAVTYQWLFLVPVTFLVLTVVAVGLIGEGLRRSLDPGSHDRDG